MTAKEYLSQARYLDARINTKIKQLEALNTLATSATSVLTGMPHSPNKATSKMADIVDKIVDLQAEINRDIDALVDLKCEMRSKLEMVVVLPEPVAPPNKIKPDALPNVDKYFIKAGG